MCEIAKRVPASVRSTSRDRVGGIKTGVSTPTIIAVTGLRGRVDHRLYQQAGRCNLLSLCQVV